MRARLCRPPTVESTAQALHVLRWAYRRCYVWRRRLNRMGIQSLRDLFVEDSTMAHYLLDKLGQVLSSLGVKAVHIRTLIPSDTGNRLSVSRKGVAETSLNNG
jgi:hypothetical protein